MANNKVLLRERKRHTARRVASARYAALSPDERGGGGCTHPVLDWGGYTICCVASACYAGGGGGIYPIQSWWGVSHPVMAPPTIQTWPGGYPRYPPPYRPGQGGTPGTPHHPDLGWGTPPPPSDLGWGTPHPDLEWGTPTIQTWDGVVPHHQTWDGLPPPPTIQTWDGVTPPPPSDLGRGPPPPPPPTDGEQADIPKYKYYLPSYYVRGR